MASSNRHWPSMFKSKPHQWHHDINHSSLLSGSANCHKSTFASGLGGEERTPEPKPRWNPRPEQIRILESIFNSGMVNPPRDEIRKIRAQLQEYGQVGDANVFYWFQNRKSRTKHKQRTQSSRNQPRNNSTTNAMNANTMNTTNAKNALVPVPTSVPLTAAAAAAATSSSSSSSEMSTGSNRKILPLVSGGLNSMMDSPTASVNQNNYFGSTPMENMLVEQGIGMVPGLWTGLMIGQGDGGGNKIGSKLQNPNPNPCPFGGVASDVTIAANDFVSAAANGGAGHDVNEFLELGGEVVGNVAPRRVMVLINGVMVEIMEGPLNVRQVFGELVLIHSSGHPVLTDEWGFTLHPLQHGASYYLI